MPQNKEQGVLQQRKINREFLKKRIRILIILGILLLIVIGLITWASIQLGGFNNLFAGTGNPIQNAVSNVGTIGTTASPTPTPTEFTINDINTDPNLSITRTQNALVFVNSIETYSITITKGTNLEFVNQTGKSIGLLFSDGRQIRIERDGNNFDSFAKAGTYTFSDKIDTQVVQIKGTITVVN